MSLMGLWAYAAYDAGRDASELRRVTRVFEVFAGPLDEMLAAVREERRLALLFLANEDRPGAPDNLRAVLDDTDARINRLRIASGNPDGRAALDDHQRAHLDQMVTQLARLGEIRGKVTVGEISRIDAFELYSDVIAPGQLLHSEFGSVDDVDLDREVRDINDIFTAREAASRVDALASAALVSGRMSAPEFRALSDAVAERRMLERLAVPELPAPDREAYEDFLDSADGVALDAMQEDMLTAGRDGAPTAVVYSQWRAKADIALDQLDKINKMAADRHHMSAEPYADRILLKAAVVSAIGLVAVIISFVVSVRIGRGLIRDLRRLRKAAIELSGTRLPRVMRRLAAGEDVDVDSEVPPLAFAGDKEMGQVGQAFNDVQRAAVEAAVKQAELRRGISKMFLNLARRSQVLLHRQLTLLDTMERRTSDADELADLFRLDHMTTRMRRHAEGLVILSGSIPSRSWRNPVMMLDVVRAAVAEVEDYERVDVCRMPRVAVVGPAVGDITHLIAELIENAAVFSPPHTRVHVHGERVANGFVLEIDDRGLGLGPAQLLGANQRLAETPDFELSDTDRLGLFVVSRLAQRHGVRVSLRSSAYGGTTAVVLIPNALLTQEPAAAGAAGPALSTGSAKALTAGEGSSRSPGAPPVPRAEPEITGSTEEAFRQWGMAPAYGALRTVPPYSTGPGEGAPHRTDPTDRPAHDHRADRSPTGPVPGPLPDTGPDGLPRRRKTAPILVADRGRSIEILRESVARGDAAQAEGPGGDAGAERADAASDAGSPDASDLGGLPRRVRQASLAPQLRAHPAPGGTGPDPQSVTVRERSADEVRARMASFQRGWQRGREACIEPDEHRTTYGTTAGSADPGADARRSRTDEGDGR